MRLLLDSTNYKQKRYLEGYFGGQTWTYIENILNARIVSTQETDGLGDTSRQGSGDSPVSCMF